MGKLKQKYYVVWRGVCPGIYENWTECKLQTVGFEGALYKSFASRAEAEAALHESPYEYIGKHVASSSKSLCRPGGDESGSQRPGDLRLIGDVHRNAEFCRKDSVE